jgi:ankyrin repeat protein
MFYDQIPSTVEEFAVSLNLHLLARYLLDYKRVEDRKGDHDLVKLLIRCGATLNAPIPDEKCDTALAAANRSPTLSSSMITSLLEGGADPNLIQPYGKVPVIWNAVESCDIQAVRSLLACGAKLNFMDERGHTPAS